MRPERKIGGGGLVNADTSRKRQTGDKRQSSDNQDDAFVDATGAGTTGTGTPSNSNAKELKMASRCPQAKKGGRQTQTIVSRSKLSKRKVSAAECEKFVATKIGGNCEGGENSIGSTGVKLHPLLDEMIMEHVFQYIMSQPAKEDVLRDVKNFRQVCKPWRNAATRIFRRTAPAAPVLKFGSYNPNFATYTFGKLRNFLETMRDSEMIPFRSYDITGSISGHANQKLLEEFLRICGPDMTSVDLRLKQSGTFQGIFELNGPSKFDLSKLKTLRVGVDDNRSVYNTAEAYAPIYFTRVVLNATQALRELKLELNLSDPNTHYKRNYMKSVEIICAGIPQSVKVLHLEKQFLTDRAFTYLVERGLSLEEFTLDPYYATGGSKAIHRFLRNQSAHLKTLRILSSQFKNDNPIWPIVGFPVLGKVETLVLAYVHVISFSFAEKFPNLTCLDVGQWDYSREALSELLECAAQTAPSVKRIHLTQSSQLFLAPVVCKLAVCFPNLTELRLEQARYSETREIRQILEEVFDHLHNLEELHITIYLNREINLDSVFSGVWSEDCKTICRGRKFDNVNLAGMQIKPSMLNMTRLRKLVLKSIKYGLPNPVILTDFSIHFVFLRLSELDELRVIGFSVKNEVRQSYLKRLKSKLHLTWEFAEDGVVFLD